MEMVESFPRISVVPVEPDKVPMVMPWEAVVVPLVIFRPPVKDDV